MTRELAVAELQSDFVSAVSHEFRTPLTALRQFTELLNATDEPDAVKRQAFHRAQLRATDRLQRLVESLLDFGRMEAGARPYELKTISAHDTVRDVVDEFRRDGLPTGFSLRLTTPPDGACIDADRVAIARALWNLLDNAVKYSGDSRSIQVEVRRREASIVIDVKDFGSGIPSSEQARIFDKFVRGSLGRERGIQGTGLGLAMVRHIATAHHGSVELVSSVGAGSTFSLVVPIASPAAEAS
jgi:two-component system phosphate regulon sensor histidine kinase PhoR